jgi:hypothetical protein
MKLQIHENLVPYIAAKFPIKGILNLYCEESSAVFVIQRSSSARGTVKQEEEEEEVYT